MLGAVVTGQKEWVPNPQEHPQCRKFLTTPLPLRETLAAYQPMASAAAWTFVINEIQHGNPAIAARVRSTSPSDIVAVGGGL